MRLFQRLALDENEIAIKSKIMAVRSITNPIDHNELSASIRSDMKTTPWILGFTEELHQARNVAQCLSSHFEILETHQFPDGETLVRLPPKLPAEVIVVRSLNDPNRKLPELMLACQGARDYGAKRITLIAPYLCYMRQDKAFKPGEVISQRVVGEFIAGLCDTLITVDPHLHRTPRLRDAVPAASAISLTAAEQIGKYIAKTVDRPLLLGPDHESEQWVRKVAEASQLDYCVARKIRTGDQDVHVELPDGDFGDREIVIVDDIASTGATIAAATGLLKNAGARRIHVFVTHALFDDNAIDRIEQSGVDTIWSTDSIAHPSNCVALAGLFAQELLRSLG